MKTSNAPNTDPEAAGRIHRDRMMAHYTRLQSFSQDGLRWIEQIEQAHHEYYRTLLSALEQSSRPEDFQTWQTLDAQFIKQLSSLQAASERLVEAGAHLKRALVSPGDPIAHIKNVTWDKK